MDIDKFKVSDVIVATNAISAEYQNAYDTPVKITQENYRSYCYYLMSLDLLFNVKSMAEFFTFDHTTTDISAFIEMCKERGIAFSHSPKTREKCSKIAKSFNDEKLLEQINVNANHVDVPIVDLSAVSQTVQ